MQSKSLMAISPIDGRYHAQVAQLSSYFSEYALIKYRIRVEIEYFIALYEQKIPQLTEFPSEFIPKIQEIYTRFATTDAESIKQIESITNHDVKAVEYFLKTKFEDMGIGQYKEFIHFGLTSQDINNTSTPLSLKEGIEAVYLPMLDTILKILKSKADIWRSIPMLARTHGQAASPTRLGKELEVFIVRVEEQLKMLLEIPYSAKFGGATGNFNAHFIAYPDIDWNQFALSFTKDKLGLKRSYPTTQIEHYDYLAALFDNLKRINTILIDLCRDIWTYISIDYFHQKIKEGEVGSSAMPHKVNPIDFENAEGNLGIANSIYQHLSSKLPISRMQRDLTDSTVLRNIGVPIAHSIISMRSIEKGLNKLLLNESALRSDLEKNWAVVAEGIQTILRRERYPEPYEALKRLTRTNETITESSISNFIDNLDVSDKIKQELKSITPFNYTGR